MSSIDMAKFKRTLLPVERRDEAAEVCKDPDSEISKVAVYSTYCHLWKLKMVVITYLNTKQHARFNAQPSSEHKTSELVYL